MPEPSTTPPTEPGHYWAFNGKEWVTVKVQRAEVSDAQTGLLSSDLIIRTALGWHRLLRYTHWLGPLKVPPLPNNASN